MLVQLVFDGLGYSPQAPRLRLHPAAPRTDRVALEDDVIPLSNPIHLSDGRTINALPVKAGQVR